MNQLQQQRTNVELFAFVCNILQIFCAIEEYGDIELLSKFKCSILSPESHHYEPLTLDEEMRVCSAVMMYIDDGMSGEYQEQGVYT